MPLAGVVATAPWLRLVKEPPAWKLALARFMDRVWPAYSEPSGLDPRDLARDPEVARAYVSDPLVHDRVSARLYVSMDAAGKWALAHASVFPVPLLLMQGGADRITSNEATREFAAQVPGDCTFKLWGGLKHEIHNEAEQQEVFAFLVAWLRRQAP